MAAPASEDPAKSPSHESSNGIGQQEYTIIHLEPSSNKWKMSKIPTDQIYKEKMLSAVNFLNDYKIKTVKDTFPLGNSLKNLILVTRKIIEKHEINYKFLHVGLIQVSVKVLTRLGPNAALSVCLRDGRHTNLKNSILVAFECNASSECPINFNLFPNASYFLYDLRETESLILTIQPVGCEVKDWSKAFSVSYRMCYKLMKTDLEPKSLIPRPKLELNMKQSSILVPVANGDGVSLRRQKE